MIQSFLREKKNTHNNTKAEEKEVKSMSVSVNYINKKDKKNDIDIESNNQTNVILKVKLRKI